MHVDGLPLALELAAARLKIFPLDQLLRQMKQRLQVLTGGNRTLLEHQRAMWTTIDWSYTLLDEGDRRSFRRLAVFTGGWTVNAATAVLTPSKQSAITILGALRDQSLIAAQTDQESGETRFAMLETIREYALARLSETGDVDDVSRRHLDYYLRVAEQLAQSRRGWGADPTDRPLSADASNVRTALEWALDHSAVEEGLRLSTALRLHWITRNDIDSGRQWLATFIQLAGQRIPNAEHHAWYARALDAAGTLALEGGDAAAAQPLFDRALEAYGTHGDQRGEASALMGRASAIGVLKGAAVAAPLYVEALHAYKKIGGEEQRRGAWLGAGLTMARMGDRRRALRILRSVIALTRRRGDRWAHGNALTLLGLAHWEWRQYADAVIAFSDAVAVYVDGRAPGVPMISDEEQKARILLAHAAELAGDPNRAVQTYREIIKMAINAQTVRRPSRDDFALASFHGLARVMLQGRQPLEAAFWYGFLAKTHSGQGVCDPLDHDATTIQLPCAISQMDSRGIETEDRSAADTFALIASRYTDRTGDPKPDAVIAAWSEGCTPSNLRARRLAALLESPVLPVAHGDVEPAENGEGG